MTLERHILYEVNLLITKLNECYIYKMLNILLGTDNTIIAHR